MKQFLWQRSLSKLKVSEKNAESKVVVIVEKMNSIKENLGTLYWDNKRNALGATPHPQTALTCKDANLCDRRKLELRLSLTKSLLLNEISCLGECFWCGSFPRGLGFIPSWHSNWPISSTWWWFCRHKSDKTEGVIDSCYIISERNWNQAICGRVIVPVRRSWATMAWGQEGKAEVTVEAPGYWRVIEMLGPMSTKESCIHGVELLCDN